MSKSTIDNRLLTERQYDALVELGFTKTRSWFITIESAIDWLRSKHNIIIYDKIEPFVDPRDNTTILYRYGVKKCNLTRGYNGREYLGHSKLGKNPYALKRQCIDIAIKYLRQLKSN